MSIFFDGGSAFLVLKVFEILCLKKQFHTLYSSVNKQIVISSTSRLKISTYVQSNNIVKTEYHLHIRVFGAKLVPNNKFLELWAALSESQWGKSLSHFTKAYTEELDVPPNIIFFKVKVSHKPISH